MISDCLKQSISVKCIAELKSEETHPKTQKHQSPSFSDCSVIPALSTINSHKNVYTPPKKKLTKFAPQNQCWFSEKLINFQPLKTPKAQLWPFRFPGATPWADPNSYIVPSPRRPSAALVPAARRIGRHWSRRPRRLPGWLIHRQPRGHPRSFLGNCLCCCFFLGGGEERSKNIQGVKPPRLHPKSQKTVDHKHHHFQASI